MANLSYAFDLIDKLLGMINSVGAGILYFELDGASTPSALTFRLNQRNNKLYVEQYVSNNWEVIGEFGSFISNLFALEGDFVNIVNREGNVNFTIYRKTSEPNGNQFGSTRRNVVIGTLSKDLARILYAGTEDIETNIETGSSVALTGTQFIKRITVQPDQDLDLRDIQLNMNAETKARVTVKDVNDNNRIVYRTMNDADYEETGGVTLKDKVTQATTGEIKVSLINEGYLRVGRVYDIIVDTMDSGFNGANGFPYSVLVSKEAIAEVIATREWIEEQLAPFVSEFYILDSSNNYMTIRQIKNIQDLLGSHSSAFNVVNGFGRIVAASISLDRHGAPSLVTAAFDTLTINEDSLSSGTFGLTQAQIDILKQGEGEINLKINLFESGSPTPIGLRYAGNIDPLNSQFAFDLENTVVLNTHDPNYEADGKNRLSPFRLMGDALVAARLLTGHKQILCEGVSDLGDFENTQTNGDVSNLLMNTKKCSYDAITLSDHATSIECRHINENIQLGDQCEVEAQTIGSATTHTITFTSEVHDNTKLKAKRVENTTSISFANLASGSRVIVQIDHYEGNPETAILTIPSGVEVIGWIGSYVFNGNVHKDPSNGDYYLMSLNNGGNVITTQIV